MNTLHLHADPKRLQDPQTQQSLDRAAQILCAGGLVALPTETVYGLGANALDPAAVGRIFTAKQRPAWDPVIVHIAGSVQNNPLLLDLVEEIPDTALKLIEAFWPGPLTLLLPRSSVIPDAVTAGRPLVGIRMPAHPVAFALIQRAGIPIAAPSANLFSHTSPTTAQHVLDDLDGRIDAIVDAGPALHGVESTVLDPCQSPMVVYRPGAITVDQIRTVAGPAEIFRKEELLRHVPHEALPSPGVGIRHYAPKARLILIDGTPDDLPARLAHAAQAHSGDRVGVMLPVEFGTTLPAPAVVFSWGRWSAPEELAHQLYAGLRALDAQGCAVILCPMPPGNGIGAALRDRLRKAAWDPDLS